MAEVEYRGIHEEDGKATCDVCGYKRFELTGHIDGDEFYTDLFTCLNCGNTISVTFERDKNEIRKWR